MLAQYPSTSGQIHDMGRYAALHGKWCAVHLRRRSVGPRAAEGAGRVGRRHRHRLLTAFRRADGYGGPHGAFMAVRDAYKRNMPGRLVGVTIDAQGKPAYRMTLQTRDSTFAARRRPATSARRKVLLAVMASMYLYHWPEGYRRIATHVHGLLATRFAAGDGHGARCRASSSTRSRYLPARRPRRDHATAKNGGMNFYRQLRRVECCRCYLR